MKSIILAGGVGTRLWPLSREYYPKQFIQLDGHSLFQKTYERAVRLSGPEGIYVVTNEIHRYLVRNQIDELGYTPGRIAPPRGARREKYPPCDRVGDAADPDPPIVTQRPSSSRATMCSAMRPSTRSVPQSRFQKNTLSHSG